MARSHRAGPRPVAAAPARPAQPQHRPPWRRLSPGPPGGLRNPHRPPGRQPPARPARAARPALAAQRQRLHQWSLVAGPPAAGVAAGRWRSGAPGPQPAGRLARAGIPAAPPTEIAAAGPRRQPGAGAGGQWRRAAAGSFTYAIAHSRQPGLGAGPAGAVRPPGQANQFRRCPRPSRTRLPKPLPGGADRCAALQRRQPLLVASGRGSGGHRPRPARQPGGGPGVGGRQHPHPAAGPQPLPRGGGPGGNPGAQMARIAGGAAIGSSFQQARPAAQLSKSRLSRLGLGF